MNSEGSTSSVNSNSTSGTGRRVIAFNTGDVTGTTDDRSSFPVIHATDVALSVIFTFRLLHECLIQSIQFTHDGAHPRSRVQSDEIQRMSGYIIDWFVYQFNEGRDLDTLRSMTRSVRETMLNLRNRVQKMARSGHYQTYEILENALHLSCQHQVVFRGLISCFILVLEYQGGHSNSERSGNMPHTTGWLVGVFRHFLKRNTEDLLPIRGGLRDFSSEGLVEGLTTLYEMIGDDPRCPRVCPMLQLINLSVAEWIMLDENKTPYFIRS